MSLGWIKGVNWLATLVSAVAYFGLGAIWYARPIFGKRWMDAAGIKMSEDPEARNQPSPMMFAANFIAYLAAATAMGMLAAALRSSTAMEGLVLGLVVGGGFSVSLTLVSAVYEPKPKPASWFLITGAYNLIGLMIVGVIVSVWR